MPDKNTWIEASLTAKGSDLMSKEQFADLIKEAGVRGLMVANAEAFEVEGAARFLETDYTFSFLDDRLDIEWSAKVESSVTYASEVVRGAPADTMFKVWLQRKT